MAPKSLFFNRVPRGWCEVLSRIQLLDRRGGGFITLTSVLQGGALVLTLRAKGRGRTRELGDVSALRLLVAVMTLLLLLLQILLLTLAPT